LLYPDGVATLTVYQYPKCQTCRKALAWLDARGVPYRAIEIVEQPPGAAELGRVLRVSGLPLARLFNTSGESYRAGDFKRRLPAMTEAEALAALAADGKLIKRPLVVGDGVALVGFDPEAWEAALRR
jgi:arsenate reductase